MTNQPILSGTDKQVLWANDIRAKAAKELELLFTQPPLWLATRERPLEQRMIDLTRQLFANMVSVETSADFWINNQKVFDDAIAHRHYRRVKMSDIVNKNRVYWADNGFANVGDYWVIPAGKKCAEILGDDFMQDVNTHLSLISEHNNLQEAYASAVAEAKKDRASYRAQQMECMIGALDERGDDIEF